MDSGSDTPEGFMYETKFVVLSFLGLVPPDFDPGFSEFDVHSSDTSQTHTPFSLPGSEEGSHCASPRFLGVKSKFAYPSRNLSSPSSRQSRSPAVSPRGSLIKKHVKREEVHTKVDMVSSEGVEIHVEVDVIKQDACVTEVMPLPSNEVLPSNSVKKDGDDLEMDGDNCGGGDDGEDSEEDIKQDLDKLVLCSSSAELPPPFLETSAANTNAPDINIVSPGTTQSAFTSPPACSGDSPRLIIPPKSGQSSGSSTSEIPSKSSDSGSLGIDDSWGRMKRNSIEALTEPLKEELQEAFDRLEKEYIDVVSQPEDESITSPTEMPQACPLVREAVVAERIAHIGDMIMAAHREEIELAMQQVFGQQASSGPMSYGMFRSMVQHMVKSSAPEWYHLALMMNFTRRMAFGFLRRGNPSMGFLSDFAAKYIEENFASFIIEQGGWEAMANITPEEMEELSSRSVSPLPAEYSTSSPQPSSPCIILESPVDGWKHSTVTHVHVKVSQSEITMESVDSQSNVGSKVTTSSPSSSPVIGDEGLPAGISPIADQSGIDQTPTDQSDGNLLSEDHTEVDSTETNGGERKIKCIALATAGAAAAVAAYALMKR